MPKATMKTAMIDELLGNLSIESFIHEFLHRLPIAMPNTAHSICEWGSWEVIAAMLNARDVDVMLARANQQYAGQVPTDLESAIALSREGYTILIRHAERHHDEIAKLAEQFAHTFQGPGNAHLYATPPNQYGFSWHYDAEDVFIFQLAGQKEYELRKNSVNPWPIEETLPIDMQYEREIMPLMRVALHAGDMLYIPCGYWHRGVTGESEETAISLALGVMSRTAIDIFDDLRPHLLESLRWRQRLPLITATNSEQTDLESVYRELLQDLGNDLQRLITSDDFRRTIMARMANCKD